jgi:hypothetical protein
MARQVIRLAFGTNYEAEFGENTIAKSEPDGELTNL